MNLVWDLCHEPLENTNKKDAKKEAVVNDNNTKNKNKTNEMTVINILKINFSILNFFFILLNFFKLNFNFLNLEYLQKLFAHTCIQK